MSEEIKSHHLRALACDIEDCHNPQSWADYCRAAAAMLEIKDARIAELEAENAGLSANQCLHSIHGDEAGNPYCPRIAELEAALDQLLDDMRDGLCVCQQAKDEARAALGGKDE